MSWQNWMAPLSGEGQLVCTCFEDIVWDKPEVELGVFELDQDLGPAELFATHVLSPLSSSDLHHSLLLGVEEVGVGWVTGQAEPDGESDEDTEDTLNDVHPIQLSVKNTLLWM